MRCSGHGGDGAADGWRRPVGVSPSHAPLTGYETMCRSSGASREPRDRRPDACCIASHLRLSRSCRQTVVVRAAWSTRSRRCKHGAARKAPKPSEAVLAHGPVTLAVAYFAGLKPSVALCAASSTLSDVIPSVLPIVYRQSPVSLYVCGGWNGEQQEFLSSGELFDESTKKWTNLPPMSCRRVRAACAVAAGKLYVIGGKDAAQRWASAERFDPVSGTWEELPPMSENRSDVAATAVDGKVYVCGGFDGKDNLNSVICFDPKISAWLVCPSLRQGRGGLAVVGMSGQLFVIGGYDGKRALRSVEHWKMSEARWKELPPMSQDRVFPAAALLDGCVCVCGGRGQTAGEIALQSAERYDPASCTWKALPSSSRPMAAAAFSFSKGWIYAFGGYSKPHFLSSAWRLNPLTGACEELPSMKGKRGGAIAVSMTH
eukprot:gnl/TRDRNA2_/TRDRNA2_184309_c0_seq1.p1 gnl/TRDRNA2_/TRDRNA2_184309_c0~~gnl/TRDRNA2_/TRDRNA2_184309_c0_seq1.p1  ORF type:complete len:441 (-),score=52.02 gnl/TRDRNA2_/TRDRNA2_184309_c0_seq1:16-1305(-)